MRILRTFLLVVLLVGMFYVLTSQRRHIGEMLPSFDRESRLEIIEAAQQPPDFDADERNNIEVYRRVLPSVVNITSEAVSVDFFYGPIPQRGQGTGFIISRDGIILTNFHVVARAQQIEVTMHDQQRYPAEIVGADPTHDIAIIRVNAPNLQPATLGDSRNVVVGQRVYAIGNPFGLAGTLTQGIVSSVRSVRIGTGAEIEEAIQTDAAINPGNSGGPLLNRRGEVVGINTLIATGGAEQSAGIGFAIPINAAKAVLDDLVRYGRVRRPALGIRSLPITPELARQIGLPAEYGVLIMQVVQGSSAHRAGLQGGRERARLGRQTILLGGDLIVAIDEQDIRSPQDLSRLLNQRRAGDEVTITYYRGNERRQVKVVLQEAQQIGV